MESKQATLRKEVDEGDMNVKMDIQMNTHPRRWNTLKMNALTQMNNC